MVYQISKSKTMHIILFIVGVLLIHIGLAGLTLMLGKWHSIRFGISVPPFWGCLICPYVILPLAAIFAMCDLIEEYFTPARRRAIMIRITKPIAGLHNWYHDIE
jgi:hypothetical protein